MIKHDEWEDFIIEHGLSDIVQKIGRTKFDLHFLIHGDRSLARRMQYHTLRIGKNTLSITVKASDSVYCPVEFVINIGCTL